MKKINIFYWICTGLIIASVGYGSLLEAIATAESVHIITQLGYPRYLVPFLGIAKLLAIIVILLPRYTTLKEWAYAGLAFDMAGALYSHIALGEAFWKWVGIILPLLFLTGAYLLHHKRLALARQLTH
jgi:hypothetical protein